MTAVEVIGAITALIVLLVIGVLAATTGVALVRYWHRSRLWRQARAEIDARTRWPRGTRSWE